MLGLHCGSVRRYDSNVTVTEKFGFEKTQGMRLGFFTGRMLEDFRRVHALAGMRISEHKKPILI